MATVELTCRPAQQEAIGPMPVVSLALVAVATMAMPLESLVAWLQYDRAAVEAGQLWRLLTCQLAHWSWDHLFWDAAALLFLGWILERDDRRVLLCCIGLSAVLIPLVVHLGLPELATYRGLSGLDSAVFVLLAVTLFRKCRAEGDRLWAWGCVAMLLAFAVKVGYEVVSGGALFVDSDAAGMLPVPLVHVVGGVVGLACGMAQGYCRGVQKGSRDFGKDRVN